MRTQGQASASRLFLLSALGIGAWLAVAYGWEIWWRGGAAIGPMLFREQDLPALILGLCGLIGAAVVARGSARAEPHVRWTGDPRCVVGLIVLLVIACRLGVDLLFAGYALSRDEEVAMVGAATLRDGLIGRPIPPEWVAFRRDIMPEFFSPYGAKAYWTSAYLPVNSAIRALFATLGDAAMSGPMMMGVGLFALWRVAMRLFPTRGDAVLVVMVMAAGSVQLLLTAMTPYAMNTHFTLNMVWLALVLRGGRAGHAGAGVVAVLLAGVHQWHFPLIFLAPFLLWFAVQRRWSAMLFLTLVLVVVVMVWAKLWPAFLNAHLGPPADVPPPAGVGDKLGSLIARLEKWHPLLHLSRFVAWNNLLLVPLAVIGVWRADWRAIWTGRSIVLPLALGCAGAGALAIDQGYGWGYRYLHGYIGAFALLAGYGWVACGFRGRRVLWLGALVSLCVGGFLIKRAHDLVAPYAAAHAMIQRSTADVVLVDPRGGRFVTDLVRGHDGAQTGRPVVMGMAYMTSAKLDHLCARYKVAIFDRRDFLPLGVPRVEWGSARIAALRAHMAMRGCGKPI